MHNNICHNTVNIGDLIYIRLFSVYFWLKQVMSGNMRLNDKIYCMCRLIYGSVV